MDIGYLHTAYVSKHHIHSFAPTQANLCMWTFPLFRSANVMVPRHKINLVMLLTADMQLICVYVLAVLCESFNQQIRLSMFGLSLPCKVLCKVCESQQHLIIHHDQCGVHA